MRILLDCRFQKGAGPNVQSRYLLENILRFNSEHEFILLQHRDQPLPASPSIERIYVPFKRPILEFLWVQACLPFLLGRYRVDICHSLKHVGPLLTRVPTIIHIREVGHFFREGADAFKLSLPMRIYWNHVLRLGMKRAAHVFGNSQECVDVPARLFDVPRSKLSVMNNGLDARFRIVDDSNGLQERRQKYGLPDRYLLCVGNPYPHKNYETVVTLLARMRERQPDTPKLVFAGDTQYADSRLFELIRELNLDDEVIFTGFVDHADLVYIYNCAELLIFPPIVASFPNPTLEAMACGVPVVAVNRGAVEEITAGAALLVHDPKDVDEMLAAVCRVMNDDGLRAKLIEHGLKRSKDFQWKASVQKVFDVYRGLERP